MSVSLLQSRKRLIQLLPSSDLRIMVVEFLNVCSVSMIRRFMAPIIYQESFKF